MYEITKNVPKMRRAPEEHKKVASRITPPVAKLPKAVRVKNHCRPLNAERACAAATIAQPRQRRQNAERVIA